MAHVLKIKSAGVSSLTAHYERSREGTLARSNIDESRTHLNYNLAQACDVSERVRAAKERTAEVSGRKVRDNTTVLFDWVITLPQDCPAEYSREFFGACADFIRGRYGVDNLVSAWVHMDETTPHMHACVLPMVEGKLNAKAILTRSELQHFHGELNKCVDERLGFHVSVLLDESEKAKKALSRVPHDKLGAATAELDAELAAQRERLERLRGSSERVEGEIGELEPTAETLLESIKNLWTNRGVEGEKAGLEQGISRDQAELREIKGELATNGVRAGEFKIEKSKLGKEVRGLEKSITKLESMVQPLAKQQLKLRAENQRLGERIRELRDALKERVEGLIGRIQDRLRALARPAPTVERDYNLNSMIGGLSRGFVTPERMVEVRRNLPTDTYVGGWSRTAFNREFGDLGTLPKGLYFDDTIPDGYAADDVFDDIVDYLETTDSRYSHPADYDFDR